MVAGTKIDGRQKWEKISERCDAHSPLPKADPSGKSQREILYAFKALNSFAYSAPMRWRRGMLTQQRLLLYRLRFEWISRTD